MILPVANVLQPLIDVGTTVLLYLHDNLGFGWGASIIVLTFITRLAILPLSIKQLRSIRSMQVHAPQIKEIQQKYKNDRQRLQQELMRFYQENKINPFASCIPLLLQLPVFLTLFYVLKEDLQPHLKETAEVGGNIGWWFINDLGEKATGGVLITLVIVYFLTMVGSSLVMAASADKQQRTLMFILPVIFTPIIIGFPAGLVLYWITTNVWTIGQQYAVKELMPAPKVLEMEAKARHEKPPPAPPRKKKKRR
jgi:YidC/Oxa1 family membrane protein insertase